MEYGKSIPTACPARGLVQVNILHDKKITNALYYKVVELKFDLILKSVCEGWLCDGSQKYQVSINRHD